MHETAHTLLKHGSAVLAEAHAPASNQEGIHVRRNKYTLLVTMRRQRRRAFHRLCPRRTCSLPSPYNETLHTWSCRAVTTGQVAKIHRRAQPKLC